MSEIIIIFVLLLANGVFAMSEIAIVSARKTRLQQLIEDGNEHAKIALELAENPNRFLSTIQVGITSIGILAGTFGGATIAEQIKASLSAIPWLASYAEAMSIGVVVISITFCSLIIGELVPKRIGLANAERFALQLAPMMNGLSKIASPVVWLLMTSTDIVLNILGIQAPSEPAVTEEDVKSLVEQGTQIGVFEETEQDMIEGVLSLDERRVNIVMTPRSQMVWLDVADSLSDIRTAIVKSKHSHFPVAEGDLDNVIGILDATELLALNGTETSFDLRAHVHPALFVPENFSTLKTLEVFKRERTHMALVIDEYGGIEGLVTSNDILETIVGDMFLEESQSEPRVFEREDGSFLLDGLLHIDQLKKFFDIEELPDEDEGNYQTVGGFVSSHIEHLPAEGQHFEWNNMRFEIMDMDGRRVDKVLVVLLKQEERKEEEK